MQMHGVLFFDAILRLPETHRRLQHAIKEIIGRRVVGRSWSINNKTSTSLYDAFLSRTHILSPLLSLFCAHICLTPLCRYLYTHLITLTLSVARGPRNHELVVSFCEQIYSKSILNILYPS